METIEINWQSVGDDPHQTAYFINGSPVGLADEGFNRILNVVRENPAAKVIVRMMLLPLGGQDLKGATPFADRFEELDEAMGERQAAIQFA